MDPQDDEMYEFGPFRLDVGDKLLWREGVTVPLEPTQFEVLAVLARAAGHLVTREHLVRVVWKDTHVEAGSLTVTISMLRKKLGDTSSRRRYIETVRKSGYRFVAPVTRSTRDRGSNDFRAVSHSQPPDRRTSPRRRAALALASVLALGGAFAVWYSLRSGVIHDPRTGPVLLYPFGGIQDDPSLSPDGGQIAFTWRPPQSDNHDIYVLRIGHLESIRLTTDLAADKSPAWSPDGRQIAFIRRTGSKGRVLLISPAGGPEQEVGETEGTSVAWSADSKTLALIDRAPGPDNFSIFLVPATGGAKRQVTFPAAEKTYGDSSPAISPDGRLLAFVRHATYDVADIFVQPLDAAKARQITFDKRQIRGLAWMPEGHELVFSSNRSGPHQLWRVNLKRTAQPRLVESGTDARSPVISRTRVGAGYRVAYQALTEDYNLHVLQRPVGGGHLSAAAPFAPSVRGEQGPRVSPDRRQLAFVSDRSGFFEVWVCAYPEASNCRQLTSFQQGYVGSPSWSPDSQRIAFDARVDGNADIYVVRADGGQPVRLTHEPSVESRANWSADGRWMYFRSDRTGAHEIWKVPIPGGAPSQVTRNGGFEAFESPDGTSLYYVQGRYTRGLWNMPLDGGQEARVGKTGSLTASSWAIIDTGILWIDVTTSNPPATVRFYDFATREVSTVAEVTNYVLPSAVGFSAVRDGTIMMWSQLDRSAHDLMLLERFR